MNKKKWLIESGATDVVRDIFKMCMEGKGNETIEIPEMPKRRRENYVADTIQGVSVEYVASGIPA